MTAETRSLEALHQFGSVFRAKEAHAAGVSWRDLYRLRDDGRVIELSRGLFQLADRAPVDDLDFVVVCARAPRAMICLESALAHWDLSDEIPTAVQIAVPKGTHRPTIDYPPTKVHVFNVSTFEIGREQLRNNAGDSYIITNRERSVVDAFRLQRLVGETMAQEALRRYLAQRGSKPALVMKMAQQLRAPGSIASALRLLVP